MPKAGSTLLMSVLADICKCLNIPIVDLPTRAFNLGIQPTALTEDINSIWESRGYAYLGFRSFFPSLAFNFSTTKNILLVRDPRDMLVSLFFSIRDSHVLPQNSTGSHPLASQRAKLTTMNIDQAVIRAANTYIKYFHDYITLLPATTTTRIYRYEDIIFMKKEWIEDMLSFLELSLPDQKIVDISSKHDIRPRKENPREHVRQVLPGNYHAHLSAKTIEKLNDIFRVIMRYFHYTSVDSFKLGDSAKKNINEFQKKRNSIFDNDYITRLERDLSKMQNSLSWRITAPLRKIKSILK